LCHCRKTINKNEEDSGDDHGDGGGWRYSRHFGVSEAE
jgi:hypothetical protein